MDRATISLKEGQDAPDMRPFSERKSGILTDGMRKQLQALKEHDGDLGTLSYPDPCQHIWEKYRQHGSPYFRKDMSKAERDMAYAQEYALPQGRPVCVGDPCALASSGGLLNRKDLDRIARQEAQAKLDELIKERTQESGEATF